MANATATTGSPSPGAQTKSPFAGVVLFGKSPENPTVFEWACKHLAVSKEYKLCIILVTELNDTNPPPVAPRYNYHKLEAKFKKDYPDCKIGELQDLIYKEQKHIWGIEYDGDNFQETLQDAVNKLQAEGLDTLVLRWSDDPQRTPVNRLESKGCSILLANVDSCTRNVLSLAMGGADAGAVAAGASPAVVVGAHPSVNDAAATGVSAGPSADGLKATDSTSSEPSTGHLGRETPNPRDDPELSNSSMTSKNK